LDLLGENAFFFMVNTRETPCFLVGGFNHLEKYETMGRIIAYIMENQKCLKPPAHQPVFLCDLC